jgi:hypothetical protein
MGNPLPSHIPQVDHKFASWADKGMIAVRVSLFASDELLRLFSKSMP